MMAKHESEPAKQKVTEKCFLSPDFTILSLKIRIANSKIEIHGLADPVAEDGSESDEAERQRKCVNLWKEIGGVEFSSFVEFFYRNE